MIRPDDETMKSMALAVRQHPLLLTYLENWQQYELNRLPDISKDNVVRAQGRCQVLSEVVDLLRKSPDNAAQS